MRSHVSQTDSPSRSALKAALQIQVSQASYLSDRHLTASLTCATCDIRQLIHVRKAGWNQVSQPSDVSLAHVRHEQKST